MAPSRACARLLAIRSRLAPQVAGTAARALRRPYHSYDHPPTPGVFSDAERAILAAAYAHVPEYGFTQRALALGARDAGYLDISTSLLPDGAFSLIKYHLVTKREALAPKSEALFGGAAAAASSPASTVSVDDKVERLTWERLLENQNVIHRWQEVCDCAGLNFPFHPRHPPEKRICPRDGNLLLPEETALSIIHL
jgi:ubiquinone biosynthesis protein COQ9